MSPRKQKLVAVTPGGDITDDMIAGYYLAFSIGEDSVALSRARNAFRDNGLDATRLPKVRRPEHTMQEACTKSQRVSQNGHREEIRAQQVGRDEEFLIYQMTRHVHDIQERVIEHPKALRVLFNFKDETLSFEQLDGADTHVEALQQEIQDYFDSHQAALPGRGLRTHIRHYLEAAGAEFIRDGFYFLPRVLKLHGSSKLHAHHGDTIDALSLIQAFQGALAQTYRKGQDWLFHEIACVNDEGQRAFLKRRFMENCAEDLKAYRDECLALIQQATETDPDKQRKRAFRTDLRTRLVEERRAIDMRRQQFAEILGETLGELDRDMKLADAALAKFLTEADA